MDYVSTRGLAPVLGFEDVLLTGLARDGGLYVPASYPSLAAHTIGSFAGQPFASLAANIMHPFLNDAIGRDELAAITGDAYAAFGHPAVTPLVQIEPNTFILELFHGPTLAFKDVAMQVLARLMDRALAKRGTRATIVGATSGDTGGAAIEAFRGAKNADVVILFPGGRVSDVQRRMMTTPKDANVHAVAIAGTFDDCQALVKAMFNDHAFRDRVALAAVNSINWARIVAQVPYYFAAGVALGAPRRPVSFAVPTGNFGDIFAGWVAQAMGLRIEQLIIATNENDILRRAHAGGVYEMRGVTATTSPSMDIQVSSNFERWLFEASGRDAEFVRGLLNALAQEGRFDLGPMKGAMRRDFDAASASEGEVADAIRHVRAASGYLMDPHTACAYVGSRKCAKGAGAPRIILATAHPAKFPDAMERITAECPAPPPRLAPLLADEERITALPNDAAAVKAHVAALVDDAPARARSGDDAVL